MKIFIFFLNKFIVSNNILDSMEIETVIDPDKMKKMIPIIKSAWGMNTMDQLVKDMIAAMRFHGGLALIAMEDGNAIGMHFSFTGRRNGKIYLYSHMTGVLSDKKYSGVGFKLKMRQKEWAMENGFDLIAWTYDPLMGLNANFNIRKIGAIARTYLRNFYGDMEDSLNYGIPSDRFVAEWRILDDRKAQGKPMLNINALEGDTELNVKELPDVISFKIPEDFLSMKKNDKDAASMIRLSTRTILENLFSSGFTVTDFHRDSSSYIMTRCGEEDPDFHENIFK